MNLSIEVIGEEKLLRELKGVAADVSDFRPSWRAVSDEVYSIERAQFNTEGSRGSGRWAQRAQSTLDRITSMNSRGFTAKVVGLPLRRTDAMHNALTTRGGSHSIYEETPDSLTLGTSLPYANIHQRGGGKIPQRKLYDLTEADGDRLMSILKRGLTVKIADRGFDVKTDDGGLPF